MNSMAMFARERPCLSWRLPENPTISDDAQRNGSTLDTRFRHTHGHAHKHCFVDAHLLFLL